MKSTWLRLGLLAFLPISCGGEGGGKHIAVIPKGTTHEFWKAVHAGAETAARDLGYRVTWQGPLKEDDRIEQIKVVESFIAKRVAGIVIAPLDDRALVSPLLDATSQGIPVIVIDSDVAWDGRVSFVATDNYKGGVLAAEKLSELLAGRGKVIMMRYAEGSASTTKREAGFLETMQGSFPRIEIVSSNQRGGATVESAYNTAEALLQKHQELDGIFCPNESTTFGMLRALQDHGRAGEIRFIGFDSSEKLIEGVEKGHLDGLVIQNPFAMGELGVRRMVDHLRGKKVESRIDTGVVLVTKDNMQEPKMRKLLVPDLSILGQKDG